MSTFPSRHSACRSPRRPRNGERGYVLLLVLGLTVILLLGATAIYNTTDARRAAFGQVRMGAIAVANAQMGAQDAVSKVRSGLIALGSPATACPSNIQLPCDAVYTTVSANDPVTNLAKYQYWIFHRTVPGFSHAEVMVSSTGYGPGGVTTATSNGVSAAQFSATVEVQLQTQVLSTMGNSIAGGS